MNKKILHTVLERVAARCPDRPAVEAGGESVSHRELHRRANRLAHALRAAGAGPETIVGVLAPAGIDYVAAVLGVMKAGAVFLPLDPRTPPRRLDRVLGRVRPSLFVAPAAALGEAVALLVPRIPAGAAWTLLTPGAGDTIRTRRLGVWADLATASWPDTDPEPAAHEDGGCYVMLTSGSTGDPKAILGSQKGLSHFVHWEVGELALDEGVRASQLAPTTFDVSLRDIFVPLLAGGTVCVPDAETRGSGRLLLRWLEESRVTLVHCVPSVLRLLLREMEAEPAPGGRLPAVRHLLSAGEALYGADVLRWMDATGGRAEVLNLYGPSETTLAKLFHRVRERPAEPHAALPVGRPLPNTAVLILNDGALCAVGEVGEVHIDTPFRTLGYYGDPEATRRAFVPNPLAPGSGEPLYRTGDLGRYLPDRSVELLGRTDRQVKVNGVRIELAEIEKAAMACEAVDRCVVVPAHGARESSLACYYTLHRPFPREALRDHLAAWLPAAMLPAFFVEMDELPLNPNGKVDRRALPRPEELLYERIPFAPPAGETEERLAALWGEMLGMRRVGVDTPFVDLGGSSLDAVTLIGRVWRAFGAEVGVREFFEHSTVRRLAALIDGRGPAPYAPIERTGDADDYPVSPAQRRLWVLQQMDPGSSAYHLPFAFDLAGPFDPAALLAAFTAVMGRHESLRTTFVLRDGEPRQRVAPPPPAAPVEWVDLSALDPPGQAGALERHAREMASAPMDLAAGPLLRVRLLRRAPEHHRLLVTLHHVIADGWSLERLLDELSHGYAAARSGADPALPPLRVQYRDYAAWQNRLLAGEAAAAHRRFWHERLAGAPPAVELPTDLPRPPVRAGRGARLRVRWDAGTLDALQRCARGGNASLFQVLLAGLNVLLYRHTGQADLVVGTPVAGRGHPDLEAQVGFYVNTLALRNRVEAGESFASLLARVAAGALEAFEHQAYPFDRLVEELAIERDPARPPLVQVLLVLHNQARGSLSLPGLRVQPLPVQQESSRFDLALALAECDGGLDLEVTYDPDLFTADRVGGLVAQLHRLLRAAAADPGRGVETLPLLDPAEERALVELGRGPVRDWGAPLTVVGRFEARAAAAPGAVAVRAGGTGLTYGQLDARAREVASFLAARGAVRGAPVGVALERGVPQIVAMLGVMKAGCAYLPLDPAHPAERLDYMLRDSGCALALTDSRTRERVAGLAAAARLVDLEEVPEEDGAARGERRAPGAAELAYLIYTSGSTGRPKGVLLEHGGLCNMVLDQVERFGVRESDRVLAFASPSFDASLYEQFMALAAGAAVVVADAGTVRDPAAFCAFVEAERVSVATLPPVYLRALARHPLPTVRTLITAGEAADPGDALHYAATRQYVNAYGPTECSVCACVHRVDPAADHAGGIPVGRPVANTGVLVLDAASGVVPVGVEGELCVWGAGLARGYAGSPPGAGRSFVFHPGVPGKRLYRTGDRARLRADGCVEFRGRVDEQIKVRGHRVEPGEVRARLLAHPALRDAVVVARRGATGETELVAYAVPADEPAPAEPDLRDWVSAALPAHLVPARIVRIGAIPLNRSGKVDREALPEPPRELAPAGRRAPSGRMEALIAEAWEEVLGRRGIGMEESYFSLGGDSIRAIQIVSRLRARGVVLRVPDLFRYPTVAQLARHAAFEAAPGPAPDDEDAAGPYPPTPIQLWLFETYGERAGHFNQSVLLRAAEPVDEGALSAALAAIQRHHDALRTVFEAGDGALRPRVREDGPPVALEAVDLRGAAGAAVALARHASGVQAGFDLRSGPLLRAVLYRADEGDRVFLAAHHLVVDGISWRILLEDLETAYAAARRGRDIVLPPKTASFRGWAKRLREYAASPALLAQREYWAGMEAAGRALPPLPREPAPAAPAGAGPHRAAASLAAGETAALLTTAHQAYNTGIDDLLLTALGRALAAWHGGTRTLVALEGHGREPIGGDLDVGRTVGWFTSIYPVVLDAADPDDPGAQVKRTKEMLRAVPARGIGYGVLRHLPRADDAGPPLGTVRPEIGFNYLGQFGAAPAAAFSLSAEPTGPSRAPGAPPVYAVEIDAAVEDGVFSLSVACDPDRHGPAAARALAGGIVAELRTVVAHCTGRDAAEPTPSDVDFDGLSAGDLDRILASLG